MNVVTFPQRQTRRRFDRMSLRETFVDHVALHSLAQRIFRRLTEAGESERAVLWKACTDRLEARARLEKMPSADYAAGVRDLVLAIRTMREEREEELEASADRAVSPNWDRYRTPAEVFQFPRRDPDADLGKLAGRS